MGTGAPTSGMAAGSCLKILNGIFYCFLSMVRFYAVNCRKRAVGSGCSTAVERAPRKREVMGSIPPGGGLFSSSILSNVSLNRSPQEGAALLFFLKTKNAKLCSLEQNMLKSTVWVRRYVLSVLFGSISINYFCNQSILTNTSSRGVTYIGYLI